LIDDDRVNLSPFYGLSDTGLADPQWPILDQEPRFGSLLKRNRSTVTPYKDGLLFITGTFSTEEAGQQLSPGYGPDLLMRLGGYQNFGRYGGVGSSTYFPTDTPDNIAAGSSRLSSPAAVNTVLSMSLEGMELKTTPAGTAYYQLVGSAGGVYARVRVSTPASVFAGDINGNYASLRQGGVELRLGQGEAQVFDVSSGVPAPLSALLTLSDEMRDWFVTFKNDAPNDTGWVMYKKPSDQVWTLVSMTGTMAVAGSAAVSPLFGHFQIGTITSTWASVQFVEGIHNDSDDWSLADYHPTHLFGRPFSLSPIHIADGWAVESKGSAAFVSDEWASATDYEHPIEVIHPEIAASPRVQWRSTSDNVEITVEWDLNGGNITRPLSPAIAVHLNEINFKTAFFEGWDGAAWVTLGQVDTATDWAGCEYSLMGNIVSPRAGGGGTFSAKRYIGLEDLRGSYAVFDPGGAGESIHAINHNSEGSFSAAGGTAHIKSAEIEVSGNVAAVAAAGAFEVRENQATLVVYKGGVAYQKYRLRIPVQDTAEGYFKIGACLIGPLLVYGADYSWGRTVASTANQTITTGRAGDRIVEELGPIRRQVQFAWTEAWDARPTGGDSPIDFDHLSLGSPTGLAVRADPTVLAGALRRLRGAKEPTVYLPRIPESLGGVAITLTGRDRHIYGRIVSPVTQQSVLGDEGTSEAIVINQIVIDEEL
jgi:hypothetical protein